MEHGPNENIMEQSQMEVTVKAEVAATRSANSSGSDASLRINLHHLKQEPGLIKIHGSQSLKSATVQFIKEEILEDSSEDGAEQQDIQCTSTLATAGSLYEANSMSQGDCIDVKQELEEMEIGPTVLQHMDIHYALNKNRSAVTEDISIMGDCNKARPIGSEEGKDNVEDELRDNDATSHNCGQATTEVDYDMAHAKSCPGEQKHLQPHILHHHKTSSNSFKCDRTFDKPHLMSVHNKLHHYTAAGCSNQTGNKKTKTKQKQFKCNVHENEFSSKTVANVHKCLQSCVERKGRLANCQSDIDGREPCNCGANFAKSGDLTDHVVKGDKLYRCDTCFAEFAQSSDLTKHIRVHTGEKPYQCDMCGASFAESSGLTQHMRVHSGEKPYQCDTCDAKFTQSNGLTQHMRVHTGKKPYICDICCAKFTQSSGLTQHMRVHTGEKPYQCNICQARFAQSNYLTKHKRVHSGEKLFKCDTCKQRFARHSNLTRHMRVHTMEKPYKCDKCEARFRKTSNLNSHVRIHMGKKPYQCNVCDARFARKNHLTRHTRVHTDKSHSV